MSTTRAQFETLLDLLDRVFNRLGAVHSGPHDFETGVPLHRSEIHTVQAIGESPGVNVTKLARHMGVTKGAVSQIVNKLGEKGLVRKFSAPDNAKEVLLELTARGRKGFETHQRFHMEMYEVVRDHFGGEFEARLDETTRVIKDLLDVLDEYERRGLGR